MTESPAVRSALDALRQLTAGIELREQEAQRLADLIKTLPEEAQKQIRVGAAYCPHDRLLEVFRIPPTMKPELPFLVIPTSSTPGYGAYWAIPEQDYIVRCRRCPHQGEVVLTMPMLTGESPPPDGYRVG